jgi:hypothetical protein
MALELMGRDLWLRHTDTNGKSHVVQHRVWDGDRFVEAQKKAAEKVNEQQKDDEPKKARVDQITEDQYLKERQS